MKVNELKGYGVTGKKVEFNLMDCYEAQHMLSRINELQKEYHDKECPYFSMDDSREAINILELISVFLSKFAVKPGEMSTIFTPDEDEPVCKETEQC